MNKPEIEQAIYYAEELLKALEGYRDKSNVGQLQTAYRLATEIRTITGEEVRKIKQ